MSISGPSGNDGCLSCGVSFEGVWSCPLLTVILRETDLVVLSCSIRGLLSKYLRARGVVSTSSRFVCDRVRAAITSGGESLAILRFFNARPEISRYAGSQRKQRATCSYTALVEVWWTECGHISLANIRHDCPSLRVCDLELLSLRSAAYVCALLNPAFQLGKVVRFTRLDYG